jgi:hypothetical protein
MLKNTTISVRFRTETRRLETFFRTMACTDQCKYQANKIEFDNNTWGTEK